MKSALDSPWRRRSVRFEPENGLLLLECPLEQLIPALLTGSSAVERQAALNHANTGVLRALSWEVHQPKNVALYAIAELAYCNSRSLCRTLANANRAEFEVVALAENQAALLVRSESEPGEPGDLICSLVQAMPDLKAEWDAAEASIDGEVAERDRSTVLPENVRASGREQNRREDRRWHWKKEALHHLRQSWLPRLKERLPFGVCVREKRLVKELKRAAAAGDANGFARRFEDRLRDLGLEAAADGEYIVRETMCGREQRHVLLVEYAPRAHRVSIHEVINAARFLLPRAFISPPHSGWKRPEIEFPLEGSTAVVAPPRPGRLPEADDIHELTDRIARAFARPTKTPDDRAVRERIAERGTEAVAWYQPFHFWDDDSWGIYYDVEQLEPLIRSLHRELNGKSQFAELVSVLAIIEVCAGHELLHARCEALGTSHELRTRRPMYLRYHENVYQALMGTQHLLEEAIANFSGRCAAQTAITSLKGVPLNDEVLEAIDNFICGLLDQSPPGYRDWRTGNARSSWSRLTGQVVQGRPAPKTAWEPLDESLAALPFDFQASDVPMFFVGSSVLFDALFAPLPFIAEFVDDSARGFRKALDRLEDRLKREWDEIKKGLLTGTLTPGRDFKLWERRSQGSIYSVRLDRNFRAHLESLDAQQGWRALDIGSHKAMGHG